ncbi:DUF1552 domain-containing protein [Cystobacter ferrugineus]|uniref:Tat (Twin-arginine translocation) pathway signal sequence domain protein n=1 Tax=Cystobacter ferrugineus TaxID=83449 RepID=A0A1L9BBT1_9BACT|nr:DUF1552 domain-containing protein [Cystobacter ferrugineus]OJH39653.1 Tat (twin-arginine translocation) pathway signal sequence domain protein [Cystobacter ferrugineus]
MRRLGRRQFTAGIGATLLASPLVRLLNGEAQAATPTVAKRLIVFFTPNGTVHKHWRPTGTETSFTFAAGSILEPLNRLRSKLLVCDGLDFVGADNHDPGMAHMLTGSGTASSATAGMSIDQYIANKLGQGSRFKSLEFGVQTSLWGSSRSTRMSYSAPGVFVSPEDVPLNAYQRLFGTAGSSSGEAERLLRRRKSMLDVARTDLSALSTQVGSEERIKLEQHIEALRQTEQALAAASTTACSPGQAPAIIDAKANANFPTVGKMQMDLLVNALACGMTRVASLQWAHTIAPQVFTWAGASEAHHELSHKVDSNTAGVASFVKCERWFAEQFAYLIDALQARPDLSSTTGGTLLDSTIVVWAKELGDSRLHTCRSVPFILAGGSGTPFRFGRYLRYSSAPHQKLLTSVCQGMGLTLDTFGDASRSTGPLDGLV